MITLLNEGNLVGVRAWEWLQFLSTPFCTGDLVRPKLSFQRGKVGLAAPISGNRCGEDPCIGRLQIFPCRTAIGIEEAKLDARSSIPLKGRLLKPRKRKVVTLRNSFAS